MIYVLIPKDGSPMRLFTSFSSIEQVVVTEALTRKALGYLTPWCYVLEYEGLDELVYVMRYEIVGESCLRASR
jgi:hypothetical protein